MSVLQSVIEVFLIWLNRLFEVPFLIWAAWISGVVLLLWLRRSVRMAELRAASVESRRMLAGSEASHEMLRLAGVDGVSVQRCRRPFANYYDLGSTTIRLAPEVFDGTSLLAIGMAAHEVGHALQHARRDAPLPLGVRDGLAIASRLGWLTAMLLTAVGLVIGIPLLLWVGLVAFPIAVLLPAAALSIERDASHRARRALAMAAQVESPHDDILDDLLRAAAWESLTGVLPRIGPGLKPPADGHDHRPRGLLRANHQSGT